MDKIKIVDVVIEGFGKPLLFYRNLKNALHREILWEGVGWYALSDDGMYRKKEVDSFPGMKFTEIRVECTYYVGPRSSGRMRTIYEPLFGVAICEEDTMPYKPFKQSTNWAWVDIAVDKETAQDIADVYSGSVRECPYCKEDHLKYYVQFNGFKEAAQFAIARACGRWPETR